MSDLGYERAAWNGHAYNHGWVRAFRGSEIPKFQPEELEMFEGWKKTNNIRQLAIYLTDAKFSHCLDDELVLYVVREVLNGSLVNG